jgi:hypothetical protein
VVDVNICEIIRNQFNNFKPDKELHITYGYDYYHIDLYDHINEITRTPDMYSYSKLRLNKCIPFLEACFS